MITIKSSTQGDLALELVDLDRYPIADMDHGTGADLLAECQNSMETHGWCNLDGFIRADALAWLNTEANDLLPLADVLHVKRNIYQGAIDHRCPRSPFDFPLLEARKPKQRNGNTEKIYVQGFKLMGSYCTYT